MLKAHHGRGDRDAALALDRHPIRAHPPPLDLARKLDRPTKQQQFLGQGGLAGVGVRNDRKGAPAQNLVGQGTHQSAIAVGYGPSQATRCAAPALTVDLMGAPRFANSGTWFSLTGLADPIRYFAVAPMPTS